MLLFLSHVKEMTKYCYSKNMSVFRTGPLGLLSQAFPLHRDCALPAKVNPEKIGTPLDRRFRGIPDNSVDTVSFISGQSPLCNHISWRYLLHYGFAHSTRRHFSYKGDWTLGCQSSARAPIPSQWKSSPFPVPGPTG